MYCVLPQPVHALNAEICLARNPCLTWRACACADVGHLSQCCEFANARLVFQGSVCELQSVRRRRKR